jgi:hypothetical protein
MLPAEVSEVAGAFYTQQQQTARKTANEVQRVWNTYDGDRPFWDWWYLVLPNLTDTITVGQYENATRAQAYVREMGSRQNIEVPDELVPAAFLSPTDEMQEWLGYAPYAATEIMRKGGSQLDGRRYGLTNLVRQASTLTQDAGREAVGVHVAATPQLKGYYRRVNLPACKDCVILGGKWFRYNADFDRHDNCDCSAIPAAERDSSFELDPLEALEKGQIVGLNQQEIKAVLEEGADLNAVVNARRSNVRPTTMFGQKVKTVTEGTTIRGTAGQRLTKIYGSNKAGRYHVAKVQRLTPSEIYRISGDKTELRRLLYRNGYIQ